MKLISATVDWHEGFANRPTLKLAVDLMPPTEEYRFQEKKFGDSILYWAEQDGVVQFFAHSPNNERGYGGREFSLTMTDGSTRKIKGPWSSRAGAMNCHFPHSVDVTIKELEGEFPKLGFATAITVELAKKAAEIAGVEIIQEDWHSDLVYEVKGEKADA